MLAYILAIAIATYSLILFALAFFSPVIHRKDDFLWSGVGLFYALVLWLCAGRITGAVLLGQSAVTLLLLSFGWQTFKLRQAIAYPEQQWEEFSVMEWVQSRLGSIGRKKPSITPTPATASGSEVTPPQTEKTESDLITEDQTPETVAPEIIETATQENLEVPVSGETEIGDEEISQAVTQSDSLETGEEQAVKSLADFPQKATIEETKTEPPQPKAKQKQGFSLKNLFGSRKKPTSQPKSEPIAKISDQTAVEEEEEWDTLEPTTRTTPQNDLSKVMQENPPTTQPAQPASTAKNQEDSEDLSDYEIETFIADEGAETVIESYRSPETFADDFSEYQMETFIADEGAETVIESYRSDVSPYKPKAKEEAPKVKEEDKEVPSTPVESKETESEGTDGKSE